MLTNLEAAADSFARFLLWENANRNKIFKKTRSNGFQICCKNNTKTNGQGFSKEYFSTFEGWVEYRFFY